MNLLMCIVIFKGLMVKTQQTCHIIKDSSDILCPPLNCFLPDGITEAQKVTLGVQEQSCLMQYECWARLSQLKLMRTVHEISRLITNLLMEGGHS